MSDEPRKPSDTKPELPTDSLQPVAPAGASTATYYAEETAGMTIGRYKLLQLLGQGGMGAVWMAEQTEPVSRRVALKIIKSDLSGAQVLARFEAERQALAMMDHPNIAKVFDAGTVGEDRHGDKETGRQGEKQNISGLPVSMSPPLLVSPTPALPVPSRPYFVMELVKGIPFSKYCDQEHLTPKERLELFIPVCNAVQHAHQKGIIHRDLKPSNVLIALYDGKPVPKIIDFGIAKATHHKLTDHTLYTEVGQIVGTLEYMAPEQAELNNLDIDTRADIYSLGVMLYELLTGTLPFTSKQLRNEGLLEMMRLIREVEPQRPSTKLSGSEELPAIAAKRKLEPKSLSRLVKGDLDWIVMKCLEKDRSRRYETANQLGQELQRFLADEPVQAGPPSAGYRLRKFLRRNKGPVIAAALVFLALVAGIIGTGIGMFQAELAADAERKAKTTAQEREKEAADERDNARKETQRADIARKQAQDNEKTAEWRLYASQIAFAQRAWETNDADLAFHYLNACRRDFRGWEHDYLFTLFHQNQQTLRGHTDRVTSVAFSPDGTKIVSGSNDKTLKLWDAPSGTQAGRETLTLKGHTNSVTCVAFSPDGKKIVSGSNDKTLKVWDTASGQETLTLKGHTDAVTSVAFSPDGKQIVSGSRDQTLKVWDAANNQDPQTLTGHTRGVNCVAFSPDGKKIVSGSYDKTLKLWDTASGQETLILTGHTSSVRSVAFSPDGKKIVSGSYDKTLKLWDAESGEDTMTLTGHTHIVNSVAFSPDGKKIVSAGGYDKTLKLWDASSGTQAGREILTLKGHTDYVDSVAFSPDGMKIVSASADHTLKVWDTASAQGTLTLKWHKDNITSVAFSSDSKKIVSGSDDKTLKVWDAATGKETLILTGHTSWVKSVAFSPDGKKIISGSADKTLRLWDTASGANTLTLTGHTGSVTSVAFSPDGKTIVSGSADKTMKLWDVASGQETLTLRGNAFGVYYVAFSPDGKKIVGGSDDERRLKVWDAVSGREILTLKGSNIGAFCVAFSPDGKKIVCGGNDRTLKLWDSTSGTQGGEVIQTFMGHTKGVYGVSFSPDGKQIVSGSYDQTLKVWDVASGQETLTLRGHLTLVTCVAFSPDGKKIVSGSADNTLKVWDASLSMEARQP